MKDDDVNTALRNSMERAAQDMARQFNEAMYRTRVWYSTVPPPSRWTRLRWRVRDWARWPFERLRDALIRWLGCDCDQW